MLLGIMAQSDFGTSISNLFIIHIQVVMNSSVLV